MTQQVTSNASETRVQIVQAQDVHARVAPFALGGFGAVLLALAVTGIASMFPEGGADFQPVPALAEAALGLAGLLLLQGAIELHQGKTARVAIGRAVGAVSAAFVLAGLSAFDTVSSTIARRAGILLATAGALSAAAVVLVDRRGTGNASRAAAARVAAALVLFAIAVSYGAGGLPAGLFWRAGFLDALGAGALLAWSLSLYVAASDARPGSSIVAPSLSTAAAALFGLALLATGLDGTLGMTWDPPAASGAANWVALVASNVASLASLAAGAAIAWWGAAGFVRAAPWPGSETAPPSAHAAEPAGAGHLVSPHAPIQAARAAPAEGSEQERARKAGNVLLATAGAGALLTLLPWVTVTVFVTFTANPWFVSGGGETASWWSEGLGDGLAASGLIRALGPGLLVGTAVAAFAGWSARRGEARRNVVLTGIGIYAAFVVMAIVAASMNADNGVTMGSWGIGLWGSILNVAAMGYAAHAMTATAGRGVPA